MSHPSAHRYPGMPLSKGKSRSSAKLRRRGRVEDVQSGKRLARQASPHVYEQRWHIVDEVKHYPALCGACSYLPCWLDFVACEHLDDGIWPCSSQRCYWLPVANQSREPPQRPQLRLRWSQSSDLWRRPLLRPHPRPRQQQWRLPSPLPLQRAFQLQRRLSGSLPNSAESFSVQIETGLA